MANISVNNSSSGDLTLRRFEVKDRDQVVRVIDHVCAESEWMAVMDLFMSLKIRLW